MHKVSTASARLWAERAFSGSAGLGSLPIVMTSANQLTVLRMAFVPLFILLVVYGHSGGALAVFVLAGITDGLDGLIARKLNQKTPLGAFLDPIADKLLLVSAFVVFSLTTLDLTIRIPLWLTITVISRDVLLVISVLIINLTVGRRLFYPSIFGKATTAVQLTMVLTILVSNYREVRVPFFDILLYATLLLTVLSGLGYLVQGFKIIGEQAEINGAENSKS